VKRYFAFSRTQQWGVIIWSVILVVLIALLSWRRENSLPAPFVVSEADVEYVQLAVEKEDSAESSSYASNEPTNDVSLFDFDPNVITPEEWESLGFSKKQAQVIVNYRTKSGPFKYKEDLKKIYVISAEKYAALEPHILLESIPVTTSEKKALSINAATAEELDKLPLVSPWMAENIVSKRNSLGGFCSMTQLHEVYRMTEEIYQVLVDQTQLDLTEIKTINLNTAKKDEIDRHPYIDFAMTAAILKEREQRPLTSLDFLVERKLLTPENKEKLAPYIRFE